MKSKKPVRRIAAVIIVIGLIVWMAHSCIDASPPDDADLRITFDVIPEEENAFTFFKRATDEVQWPEEDAQKDLLADMASGKAWDDAAAEEILLQNEGILDLIEQGLACLRCQLPETTSYGDELTYLTQWRAIARLGSIRAQWLLQNGRDEEAFEQALLIVRFGHRIQNARGPIIAYLVGLAIEEIGLRQIRNMLADTTLDPERLAAYIPRLDECRASGEGLADAMRIEYACASNAVDDILKGKPSLAPRNVETLVKMRLLFFKPNRTKHAFAATIRTLIANASTTHAEATPLDFSKGNETFWMVRAVASGNAVGKILYGMLMPTLPRASQHKCRLNVSVATTQIFIALKCYQLEHGELPDTLGQLVPDYFDAVPLDDFDGKPMRYSKAKRIVYSIGADLVDSGGGDDTYWDADEPTFKIDF